MLHELETLVENEKPVVIDEIEKDLRKISRTLLERQFIFSDDSQNGRRFALAKEYRGYLEKLFDAIGYRLIFEEQERVVGIVGLGNAVTRPMKRDHALFLLALRTLFEEAIRTFSIEDGGRYTTSLSEIWSMIEDRARGVRRPNATQCRAIADDFHRRGIIRIRDESVASKDVSIEIRAVIRLLVTNETADQIQRYARDANDNVPQDACDEDLSDHVSCAL